MRCCSADSSIDSVVDDMEYVIVVRYYVCILKDIKHPRPAV